ncbi:MAG: radical SAM protein [Nitrospira sp.]|nr:radical SAM protein [Nitrospira sp.]
MGLSKGFLLVLIKPSHYDDDGYVIQWIRSAIPSNTLAVLNGLARDCAERRVLGEDVPITVDLYDETNTVISVPSIIRKMKGYTAGMVGLVGVQTNQFPRAVDVAEQFRRADIPVVIGGFHVSGCVAMLPKLPRDIEAAGEKGISLFAGEAEGHLDEVLRDAYQGTLKPLYNFLNEGRSIEGAPPPFLPVDIVKNTFRRLSSFDGGRGCPFQCSFCTIINVQGRTSRYRSADDIEQIIRSNLQQGVGRFFITDDDFARNSNWEAILDRCIQLREEEGLVISFTAQVDVGAYKIPRFVEKCARAGCNNIFIGLESLNPDSLAGAKKRQNKIWQYRKMLQVWKDHGCTTVAGYILGFPTDTPESIARDIEIIKNELPLDGLEFFCLTPLPGSEDHRKHIERGAWIEQDMNKYDLEHITMDHPRMSKEEWQRVYRDAWRQYYTDEHVERVLRRAAVKNQDIYKVMFLLLCLGGSIALEGIHPLEAGMFRRKVRRMRRPGMPLENPLIFYPRRVWEILSLSIRWPSLVWKFFRILWRVQAQPELPGDVDLAMVPAGEQKDEDLTLLQVYRDALPQSHIPVETLTSSRR